MAVMDESELRARILEQEREIEFLKGELGRLRVEVKSRSHQLSYMLKRRGFRIYKKEEDKDVLRPTAPAKKLSEEFYERMKKYSFRLFLRDVIKHQDGFTPQELVRYSALPTVLDYTAFLAKAGILKRQGKERYAPVRSGVTSFGPTLEWFVSELFRREYMAETVWGARFKGKSSGGDYDILAAVEGRLLYAEVKSSPPKQIYDAEVKAYIDRCMEISPDLSLFIVDTELRMKDKVVVLFEQALPDTPLAGAQVVRLKGELFHVDGRIFIVNSKDSLSANIGVVLGWYLKGGLHAA